MTQGDIHKLLFNGKFPETTVQTVLVETHISWVILCDQFVYKIKKPIKYSFLDFSTLEKRRFFCERELELNRRFSKNIYLEVLPIYERDGYYEIGGQAGEAMDYTLKMRKLDPERQMDVLLSKNKVSKLDITLLAERIVQFHNNTNSILEKNAMDIKEKFKDLGLEIAFLSQHFDVDVAQVVTDAIKFSNTFLKENESLLLARLKSGFFRDCHGDLHTRNIFLLPEPQPFDCIEFNDDYRQIDVLNEVAFLCMDLDALGRKDLSDLFIEHYNRLLPVTRASGEKQLFIYYKCYRANVRAKVNSLRAKSATDAEAKMKALAEAKRYLLLMHDYIKSLLVY